MRSCHHFPRFLARLTRSNVSLPLGIVISLVRSLRAFTLHWRIAFENAITAGGQVPIRPLFKNCPINLDGRPSAKPKKIFDGGSGFLPGSLTISGLRGGL